jgi:methionyl-tRNA formyltransferase
MANQEKRIALFLMTSKGYMVLESIIAKKMHSTIAHVIIGRDKNVQSDYSSEIVSLCTQEQIGYSFREEYQNEIEADYAIAISWRWLIQSSSRLIVLHDSLLPKYRGFAPLVNMLINGESAIGVTALYAVDEYDKGPVIGQLSVPVQYPITIAEAIDLVSSLYAELTVSIFQNILNGQDLLGEEQNEDKASYSLWRDEEDYRIDWSADSAFIRRFVDALGFPYAGAQAYINGKKIIVREVAAVPDKMIENRTPGKVIFVDEKGQPTVVCGTGLIKIIKAELANTSENIIPLKNFRIRFL